MDARHAFRSTVLPLAIALMAASPITATAQDGWPVDAGNGMAVSDAAPALAPGTFEWAPERAGPGQLVMVVSLPAQQVHVYRGGVRIGVSTVSTGTASHPTPTGVFEILQKKEMHHSNLYDNAPMPYMQRLTWDGIALHAGRIPGYPASHGCVRLPKQFAKLLFNETQKGMLVVIADASTHGPEVLYPGSRAPVDTYSGLPLGMGAGTIASADAPADTSASTHYRDTVALPD